MDHLILTQPLSPPYYREVWDYKNTDLICIQRAISLVNLNVAFSNNGQMKKLKV